MTINEIIKIVNGESYLNSNEKINNIVTDTRIINEGDIFIALKGNNFDGHDYISDALEKGAIACIVENSVDNKCIKVESTLEALYLLSNYIRNKYSIPLISITGSNGKTTTKDLLYDILSTKYKVLKNDGSKNNIIGVSETLFKLNSDYDIIVMELGTNHLGEISKLSKMCNPNLGIITNIGSSHLGYFKNKRNIFKEKTSVTDGMKDKKLIVNGDDKYLKKLKCFKCGQNKNNDLVAYNIKSYIDHITFNIYLDKEYEIIFNNPGKHFVNNILLTIKVGLDYGIDIVDIIDKICKYKLTNLRMNIEKYGTNIVINDSYNASYESVCAGIDYLSEIDSEKLIIIGDIFELGRYSKKIHKKINKKLKKLNNKEILTVGKYSKYIKGTHFNDVYLLNTYLKDKCINNKYIYIKGSRKNNLEKVVEQFKTSTI